MMKYIMTIIATTVIIVGSGEYDVQRGKRRTVKAIYAAIHKTGVKVGKRYITASVTIEKSI